MQVGHAVARRQSAEVLLQLGEGAVDVDAGVGGVVAHPHRDGGAPEPVAGDRPVAGVLQPRAELAVLDVLRHPGDLLVQLEHALLDRRDLHEPGLDALVDEGLAAPPAVRVAVVVRLAAQQHGAGGDARGVLRATGGGGLQVVDDDAVGVEDLHPGVVGDGLDEAAVLRHGHDGLDALAVGDLLVDLAEGAGAVDQPGAVRGGDRVVGGHDAEGVLVAREVGERWRVRQAHEVGTRPAPHDGWLLAQLAGIGSEAGLGQDHAGGCLVCRPRPGTPAVLDGDVVDLRAHHHREVARQGPRRRGPDQQLRALQGAVGGDVEADGDGRVLAILVDVVVHAQLVVRQRRLVVPAVREHPEVLVDQALVPQALERPDDRLHVVGVERAVVVLEVHPSGLAGDVGLPLAGVLQHRRAARLVEGVDAHLGDLVGGLDAVQAHRLELGGQAVRVPAEASLDAASTHRLVARDDVLDVAGQQVAVVRQTVGERGTVVEDELVGSGVTGRPGLDAGAEGVVLGPEVEDALLDRREARARGDATGAVRVGGRAGVRHGCSCVLGPGVSRPARGRRRLGCAAVPPRLPPCRATTPCRR